MLVKIAETIGKSIEEVMQLSVLEIQIWSAYFTMKHNEAKRSMERGNTNNRSKGPR